ncbi:SDR family oxidoreductase [Microbulbifer sp. SA54]|uniref:SDR family oxidoreductase n=1 Tax=Microbulbifer sp. SA54 TaxID=3401577 RepID=UPI003AAB39DB
MRKDASTATVLLTGAAGGIGSAIARLLAAQGYSLLLQGRNQERLETLRLNLPHPERHRTMVADLTDKAQRQSLVERCQALAGGVDVLINNAGVSQFALLEHIDDASLREVLETNLLVPIALTRDLLPLLAQSRHGAVVNIGSAFGHIGHPGFCLYGASKAGLHGFSEALRREQGDSGVQVHYLAPRAVDTTLNSDAVKNLNRALGNHSDAPETVAAQCLKLLQSGSSGRRFIGWPERLFIKVNALLPAVVDSALIKKLPVVREYAAGKKPQGEI